MNILIPLVIGLVMGYVIKRRYPRLKGTIRKNLELLISVTMAIMIFMMGVKLSTVKIDAINILFLSLYFVILSVSMPIFIIFILRRWII